MVKKGQQIRAGAPPPFSGNAQKKTFFFRRCSLVCWMFEALRFCICIYLCV